MKSFFVGKLVLQMLLLSFLGASAKALNILILYPCPSYSHQVGILALTKRLIQNGHNVYAITPNPVVGLEKNYTYVDISFGYEYNSPEEEQDGVVNLQNQLNKWCIIDLVTSTFDVVIKQHSSPQVLRFIERVKTDNLSFDVVIIEAIYVPLLVPIANEIAGSKPVIAMTSLSYDYMVENALGSIEHLSYMPSLSSHYTDKMNLLEKIENWYSHYYIVSKIKEFMRVKTKRFMRETFGKTSDLADDAEKRISISMVSSNHIYYYPRLLSPNVIELGSMHMGKPENLPLILQDWCDNAEKGVVFFCLGSNFKSKSLPANVKTNLIKVFKELSPGYRIVWKWEADEPISKEVTNILTQKWVPQHSLLAHPKTKLFITQGGLQSFQETVHYGVPTVGIPWLGDQVLNVGRMVDLGIGIKLDPEELSSYEHVKKALNTVLLDQSYSRNARKVSAISRDFSAQSVDKAVFWVEHIARHGGGDHLRPATADTTLFQFFCLDIISFILGVVLILVCSIYYISRSIFRFFKQNVNIKLKKA